MIKLKTRKFVSNCPVCNREVIADRIVSNYPCPYCEEGSINFLEGHSVKEVKMIISKADISIELSLIFNKLSVYLKTNELIDQHLFTVKNPEIREGFPQAEFPSQYNELQDEIKDWVFEHYAEVIRNLV